MKGVRDGFPTQCCSPFPQHKRCQRKLTLDVALQSAEKIQDIALNRCHRRMDKVVVQSAMWIISQCQKCNDPLQVKRGDGWKMELQEWDAHLESITDDAEREAVRASGDSHAIWKR